MISLLTSLLLIILRLTMALRFLSVAIRLVVLRQLCQEVLALRVPVPPQADKISLMKLKNTPLVLSSVRLASTLSKMLWRMRLALMLVSLNLLKIYMLMLSLAILTTSRIISSTSALLLFLIAKSQISLS